MQSRRDSGRDLVCYGAQSVTLASMPTKSLRIGLLRARSSSGRRRELR
jgi:hypothetical protein